jgi:hypothetical protein
MEREPGKFYLGRLVDAQTGQAGKSPLLYSMDDLTTHAVVVGMTGSGKTGLCIDLLEEAALNHLPAILIDPKGDITNTLLHFPDLLPADFKPWVNPDQARRAGKTLDQAAEEASEAWKTGLAQWDVDVEQLSVLKQAAQFAVFTPGSDAGLPVSILASLKAPGVPWEENREVLREQISGTVTALLGLVGILNVDPVRSREHILLANIFEEAWKNGRDLDLETLILQTQTPPFKKLGVFEVNTFFPEKDRFGLAMSLNNILAAPAFQSWIEGQPLVIQDLLYTPDGRPRHSIFYIAHLQDAERMFFVTLLFSAVDAWMRSLSGTPELRALIYFDEIAGYLPPVSNPPSKQPMLRLLKQARAFGLGLVLVTQNPVDLDYKALSNAGSWFIGKLQTDQDKQRLLDGLESAMAGGAERGQLDRLLSSLGKRVFLLNNVHAAGPLLFQTRWAMNYLAGPLTRAQIPALNRLANALPEKASSLPALPVEAKEPEVLPEALAAGAVVRPVRPPGVEEYFFPLVISEGQVQADVGSQAAALASESAQPGPLIAGITYHPALLAQASIGFLNRKYNLDYEQALSVLAPDLDQAARLRWEQLQAPPLDISQLEKIPAEGAGFADLQPPLSDGKALAALKKDFLEWAYQSGVARVRCNETLGVYAGPQVSAAEFRRLCSEAARQKRDAEVEKAEAAFQKQFKALDQKRARLERDLEVDQADLENRKGEAWDANVNTVMSLFAGRGRTTRIKSAMAKQRKVDQAEGDLKTSRAALEDVRRQIAGLEDERAKMLADISRRWGNIASQETEITQAAQRKDVRLEMFGIAWLPYYQVKNGEQLVETPAYRPG